MFSMRHNRPVMSSVSKLHNLGFAILQLPTPPDTGTLLFKAYRRQACLPNFPPFSSLRPPNYADPP